MTLPNFLIIGAPKCGTTTLYATLSQHPDVFMTTPKEPNYLVGDEPRPFRQVTDRAGYERLFAPGADRPARGEGSTAYLLSANAPGAAAELVPDARLLVLLRDPVARAYSAWAHLRQRDREPIADFLAAVEAESRRAEHGDAPVLSRYVEAGRYAAQLERWLGHFPREQLLVQLTDDLQRDPLAAMQNCFEHIGVGRDFVPDVGTRFNRSGVRRSTQFGRMLDGFGESRAGALARRVVPTGVRQRVRERLRAANLRASPPLDDAAYATLAPRFADDLDRLRELLDRDLDEWRTVRYLG